MHSASSSACALIPLPVSMHIPSPQTRQTGCPSVLITISLVGIRLLSMAAARVA